MTNRASAFALTTLVAAAACLEAQQPVAAEPPLPIQAVGDAAPDFAIRGTTRYGMLREPLRLSDYRGQTVVLWFFVRARTRG